MATTSKLNSAIERFADELQALIRDEILGSLSKNLGGKSGSKPRLERAKGEKRSPDALHRIELQLYQFVRRSPGLGIEAIGRELGMPTRELVLPLKKLIASKRVSAKGQKRSTKYFPRG